MTHFALSGYIINKAIEEINSFNEDFETIESESKEEQSAGEVLFKNRATSNGKCRIKKKKITKLRWRLGD